MRRLFFLWVAILVSPLFAAGTHPVQAGGDPGGAPCVTPGESQAFPYTVETSSGLIECITVETVTATFSNTVPVSVDLHISGQRWQQMDRYQIQIEQWREGNDIYIAIYRALTQNNAPGTSLAAPYTTTVRLDDQFEPGSVQVHVNQYTVEIAVPNAPPPGVDMPPNEPYPPSDHFTRSYVSVDDVEVLPQSRRPILHVTGTEYACPAAPLQVDQRREDDWLFVEIYRLQDPSCLAQRSRFDEYVELEWDLYSGSYVVQVNDFITTLDLPVPHPRPEFTRVYATIEYAEVLASPTYPTNLTLHVTGTYSQSCQGTLQIDQILSGSWLTVEIYQVVNPAMMCPERLVRLDEYIPLKGYFNGWPITIQVNGYIVTYPYFPPPPVDPLPPIPYD